MVVTIQVSEEVAAAAEARGLSVEDYIQRLLADQAQALTRNKTPRSPEAIRAWLDSLAQFSDKIPPMPEEITREWIYQDHD
jgi:hypothetical protein